MVKIEKCDLIGRDVIWIFEFLKLCIEVRGVSRVLSVQFENENDVTHQVQ